MGTHIYLSVGKRASIDGPLINPASGEPTQQMRYRGEAGDTDDPSSYKRMMENRGHVVGLHSKIVGAMNPASGHIEYTIGDKLK